MLAAIIAVILVLALMFLCGRDAAKLAARRGRSKAVWFLLGCPFFAVSSIVLALLPPHSEEKAA